MAAPAWTADLGDADAVGGGAGPPFERRSELMEQWAGFLTRPALSSPSTAVRDCGRAAAESVQIVAARAEPNAAR